MKGKQLLKVIRLILIGLSALSFIFVAIAALTSLKLFLVFSPLFMIGFGICCLAAQFKVKFVLKKLPFLKSLLGRALFNIYLSSIIYYYFEASGDTVLAWLGALSLFASGMMYLGMYFGCGKQLNKIQQRPRASEDSDQDDSPKISDKIRQPLV